MNERRERKIKRERERERGRVLREPGGWECGSVEVYVKKLKTAEMEVREVWETPKRELRKE